MGVVSPGVGTGLPVAGGGETFPRVEEEGEAQPMAMKSNTTSADNIARLCEPRLDIVTRETC